jgi:hypothetical protein
MAMPSSSDPNSDINLHEVEDYSSDIPHDQLPSVEEARMAAGVALGKASRIPSKKIWYIGAGLVAATLLIVAIAVPVSNNSSPKGDKQIGNSVEKAVHKISLNGKADFEDEAAYQSFAKRWLLEDDLVEDYTYDELQQRYAMYCLHHATNPDGWVDATGWKRKGVPECDWFGVTCNPDTGMVTRINLRNNGLEGQIPPEVSLIPDLLVFNVNANSNLTGSVPMHICDLRSERALDIKVDCDSVTCSCCSNCVRDRKGD